MPRITIGDAERQPLDAIPLEVLREAPKLQIRTWFEKQSEIIPRLVAEELIDIGRMSSFKLEAESRSKGKDRVDGQGRNS